MTATATGSREQHTACLLVLHLTVVPLGERIAEMQAFRAGYAAMLARLRAQPLAARRVQLAWIDACDAQQIGRGVLPWCDPDDAQVPVLGGAEPGMSGLSAEALSEMLPAMRQGLQEVERHKQGVLALGMACTRPWIVLLSNTALVEPEVQWAGLCLDCKQAERDKRCMIFPVAIGALNGAPLQGLTDTPVAHLAPARLSAFFEWLALALIATSASDADSVVQLPSVADWARFGPG